MLTASWISPRTISRLAQRPTRRLLLGGNNNNNNNNNNPNNNNPSSRFATRSIGGTLGSVTASNLSHDKNVTMNNNNKNPNRTLSPNNNNANNQQQQQQRPKERFILRLPNVGNTCYLNAGIQSLLSLQQYRQHLTDVNNKKPVDIDSQTQSFIKNMTELNTITTTNKNTNNEATPQIMHALRDSLNFPPNQPNDAQEAVNQMLSMLETQHLKTLPSQQQKEQMTKRIFNFKSIVNNHKAFLPKNITTQYQTLQNRLNNNTISNILSTTTLKCFCGNDSNSLKVHSTGTKQHVPEFKPFCETHPMAFISLEHLKYYRNNLFNLLTNRQEEILLQTFNSNNNNSNNNLNSLLTISSCAKCAAKVSERSPTRVFENTLFTSYPTANEDDTIHFGVVINRYQWDAKYNAVRYHQTPMSVPFTVPLLRWTNNNWSHTEYKQMKANKEVKPIVDNNIILDYQPLPSEIQPTPKEHFDVYQLQSFITYENYDSRGIANNGHYIAFVNTSTTCHPNSWMKFDDKCAVVQNLNDVQQAAQTAYVLFYTKQPQLRKDILAADKLNALSSSIPAKL